MKSKKTAGKRKGGYRRRAPRRKTRNVADIASLSVKRTIQPVGGGNFATNIMYEDRNEDLNSYDRAVQVAKAYQHFRIKKITLTIKPTYDTFQSGAPGGSSKMNVYYMIDKSGSIPVNPTLEQLKQMGAKAHALDEKPFKISYRPSVLTADQVAVNAVVASQYKVSPWLSTSINPLGAAWQASTIDHLGVFWYVEQLFGGGVQYNCEMELQFEFKKPLWTGQQGAAVPAMKVESAVLDDSPDGIVGGGDVNNLPRT